MGEGGNLKEAEIKMKAVYYPQVRINLKKTRFGSLAAEEHQDLYEKPLTNGKMIVRVDILESLKELWGEGILLSRENIYVLVSGEASDEDYRSIMAAYYRTHSQFARWLDEIYFFGNQSQPLIKRFIQDVRQHLDESRDDRVEQALKAGGKLLLQTHEYLYFSFQPNNSGWQLLSGGKVIR